MFTGIVQTVGTIKSIDGQQFCFAARANFFHQVNVGDSIAVAGVCLTVVELGEDFFKADVSQETLNCSIFPNLSVGANVNLEKSLRLSHGIDGHLVGGHIDGTAVVVDKYPDGNSIRFKINPLKDLVKYIAKKGSICINGVSLTVNNVANNTFEVNIIPHTLTTTTLGQLAVGDKVNIEVDIIARQLEQLLKNPKQK